MEALIYIIWTVILIVGVIYRLDQKAKFKKEFAPTESQIKAWLELEQQKKTQEQALKVLNEKLEEEKRKK